MAPFRTIDNNLHWPIPCCPFHPPFLSFSFFFFPLLLLHLQPFVFHLLLLLLSLNILKNQMTSLNKLSRKWFASSHYKLHIMGYGITYLACNSASLLLLPFSLLLRLLSQKFQEIVSVKHSFTMQVYCENRFTFQIQLENEIRLLT